MAATVLAALGTNLGNRVAHLEQGVQLLATRVGHVTATSRLYRTTPQYVEDQPAFLNIAVQLQTALSPEALLDAFKGIERDVGRTPTIRWGPRVLDVDVLFYDDSVVEMETGHGPLQIPHARIAERDFVLVPLCDVAPTFQHPVLKRTIDELRVALAANKQVSVSSVADDTMDEAPTPVLPLIKQSPWNLGARTFVMGIVNVTPDSFSDGGDCASMEQAVATALEFVQQGIDILDIGGESTRPGAAPVSEEQELARVLPVIQQIRQQSSVAISIDTTKAGVARAAIEAGANMVNDVSGGEKDPDMLTTVASLQVPIVLMHSRGTPQTMTQLKQYDDVVDEVAAYLATRVEAANRAGIFAWNIVVDPGIGFAKDRELNLQILRRLHEIKPHVGNAPVLVGSSRKAFIGHICGRPDPKDRAFGTAATCCAAIANGADILRVHDVPAMIDVAHMADAIWRPSLNGSSTKSK